MAGGDGRGWFGEESVPNKQRPGGRQCGASCLAPPGRPWRRGRGAGRRVVRRCVSASGRPWRRGKVEAAWPALQLRRHKSSVDLKISSLFFVPAT
jgi:hypothetical protein